MARYASLPSDDWESVQVRVGSDGDVDERASSHHGYNHARSALNWGSDAGIAVVRDAVEGLGARRRNGWGPRRGLLQVSGGSHAGNVEGYFEFDRIVPAGRIHLVPIESLALAALAGGDPYRFAVSPPWAKRAWLDPEAAATE